MRTFSPGGSRRHHCPTEVGVYGSRYLRVFTTRVRTQFSLFRVMWTRLDVNDTTQTGLPMSADRSRCSALCEPQLTHTVYLWSHSFAVDSRNAHFFGRGWCTEKFVRSKVLDHIIANVLFRCRSHARYFTAFSLRKFIALKGRSHYTRRYKPARASSRVFTRDGDVRQGLDLNDIRLDSLSGLSLL